MIITGIEVICDTCEMSEHFVMDIDEFIAVAHDHSWIVDYRENEDEPLVFCSEDCSLQYIPKDFVNDDTGDLDTEELDGHGMHIETLDEN